MTTSNGEKVDGYCVSITIDEIAVTTRDHRVVKIARQALSKLEMQRSRGHQLRALHKGMHKALAMGFDNLLSPMAPAGIIGIPGTLAWGAVAAPFCLLGDLRAKVSGKQVINPI
jgi:hypothetical protein